MKKKKNVTGSRLGYCPFAVLSHDTVDCIVTQGAAGAHGRPQYGRLGCDIAQRHGQGRPRHGRQLACAGPGWWIVSRYTVLYHDRGEGLAVGGCVTIQSLYRDRRAVWLAGVSRYNQLYRDRSEGLIGWGWVTIQSIVS